MKTRALSTTSTICVVSICLTAAMASAEVLQFQPGQYALRSGQDISLGSGSKVSGTMVAGRSLSAGQGADLDAMFAGRDIWLDQGAQVNGQVRAGRAAQADRDLQFTGPSWVGDSVYLARNARVQGDVHSGRGGVCIDRDAYIDGSVNSDGYVWIDRDSTISGNASPGVGQSIDFGRNVSVGGSTDPSSSGVDALSVADIVFDRGSYTPGRDGIWQGRNSTLSLDPGSYRYLSMDRNATLNLSGGTYDLGNFWMDRDGVVNVDATEQDVILNLSSLSTGRSVKFQVEGDHRLIVHTYGGNVWLDRDTELAADVTVFDGSFSAGNGVQLEGSVLAAKSISLGSGVNVRGLTSAPAAVPEPGTMALMAAGGVLFALRRRRIKN